MPSLHLHLLSPNLSLSLSNSLNHGILILFVECKSKGFKPQVQNAGFKLFKDNCISKVLIQIS